MWSEERRAAERAKAFKSLVTDNEKYKAEATLARVISNFAPELSDVDAFAFAILFHKVEPSETEIDMFGKLLLVMKLTHAEYISDLKSVFEQHVNSAVTSAEASEQRALERRQFYEQQDLVSDKVGEMKRTEILRIIDLLLEGKSREIHEGEPGIIDALRTQFNLAIYVTGWFKKRWVIEDHHAVRDVRERFAKCQAKYVARLLKTGRTTSRGLNVGFSPRF